MKRKILLYDLSKIRQISGIRISLPVFKVERFSNRVKILWKVSLDDESEYIYYENNLNSLWLVKKRDQLVENLYQFYIELN